jgi:hypothetical protein
MDKRILAIILIAGGLFIRPAFAAQKVANTSQKGSLLIYPAIDVDPEDSSDTVVEISNDQVTTIHIECFYVNEKKGRVDFDFDLTGKETATWSVSTGVGGIEAPLFPSGGTFTGNANRGELACFAVDAGATTQLAFNHLIGTATIIHNNDAADAHQPAQAFRYNAWAFAARSDTGLAADYTVQGTPGDLQLTGGGAGTYDGCPVYNIANFMPGEGSTPGSGARRGTLYSIDNDLTVVSCNQDLRQDFLLHLTKLEFTVWNAHESSFSGSYICADSVEKVPLNPTDQPATGGITNDSNFTFPTLQTAAARFQVIGVKSTQCANSENAGLLGVLSSSVGLNGDTTEDQELGSTTQHAGLESGFVLWDPSGTVRPEHHK